MEIQRTNTIKSVYKMVVKRESKHDDYVNVIENKALEKEVVSIRSFNHQLYTFE